MQDDGIVWNGKYCRKGSPRRAAKRKPLGKLVSQRAAVYGERHIFEMCRASWKIRYYAAQGRPAYAYGPGQLEVALVQTEFVDLRK